MSEDKKDFKVSDRRHFTPEGEARGPSEGDVGPPVEPPARQVPGGAQPPARQIPGDAQPPAPQSPEGARPSERQTVEGAGPSAPRTVAEDARPSPRAAAEDEPLEPPAPSPEAGDLPADLIGLFVSLAAQASYLLSDGPSEADEPRPDLGGARAVITLLEVLKAKTEGNRTSDEDRVLDGILYELRMAYLARSRTGA